MGNSIEPAAHSHRENVLEHCRPPMDLPFSRDEYRDRLTRIRERMAVDRIELLYLTSPESLFYVSGYACEWYQSESPKSWPPTSGIAVHVDHDKLIVFDTPSEQILVRFVSVADDIRIFPADTAPPARPARSRVPSAGAPARRDARERRAPVRARPPDRGSCASGPRLSRSPARAPRARCGCRAGTRARCRHPARAGLRAAGKAAPHRPRSRARC